MGWRTYLIMYFGTQGKMKASDIAKKLEAIGFESSFGSVDFIYEWKNKQPSKEQVLDLGDRIAKLLEGSGAVFNLDTHD